jgi:hypothetical protein
MSRTDVHAPAWVKERDPGWAHAFHEQHDHRHGRCDLDRHDTRNWRCSHCHIQSRWTGRNIHCGCPLCTGHHWNRAERRRDRHQWRRRLERER